jgi:hypothetical protein
VVYTRVLSVISWSTEVSLYRQNAIPLSLQTMTSNPAMYHVPAAPDTFVRRAGCCGIVERQDGETNRSDA